MRSRLHILWAGLFLSFATTFGYVGLVVGSAWWSQDPERLDWPAVKAFPWNLPYILLLALAMGLVIGVVGMVWDAFLSKPLDRLINNSRFLRALAGIGSGLMIGFGLPFLAGLVFFSIEPVLRRYGIVHVSGPVPWLLPAMSTLAVLMAAWLGVRGWRGELGSSEVVARPDAQDVETEKDFRDLDMDAETSASGVDKRGFPIFVWRESADNRLGFSRPRYCCITETKEDLLFTFFNPSQDVRTTHATTLACLVGGGIFLWSIFYAMFGGPHKPGDAFAGVMAGFLFGALAGLIIGPLCYASVTAWRWGAGRFKGDGRLYFVPWSDLEAFQVVSADATGAARTKQSPPGGHGLIASFASHAPSFPLTANFWNYESIAEQHRLMTTAFIAQRKPLLEKWRAMRKKLAELDTETAPASSAAHGGMANTVSIEGAETGKKGVHGMRLGAPFSHNWIDQEPMTVKLGEGDQARVEAPTVDGKSVPVAIERSAWIERVEGHLLFALMADGEVYLCQPWDEVWQFVIVDYWDKFGDGGSPPHKGDWHAIAMEPRKGDPWLIAASMEGKEALRECRDVLEKKFGPEARTRFLKEQGNKLASVATATFVHPIPGGQSKANGDIPGKL